VDDQKADGGTVYEQILIQAKSQFGNGSQKTELTGSRTGVSALDCSAMRRRRSRKKREIRRRRRRGQNNSTHNRSVVLVTLTIVLDEVAKPFMDKLFPSCVILI